MSSKSVSYRIASLASLTQAVSNIARVRYNPGFPIAILAIVIFAAIFPSWLAPYSPIDGELSQKLLPPSAGHLLGTDHLGRDILSRIIYGSQVSLSVAALAIGLSATIGTMLGLLSGFVGGRIDALIMRLVDIALSIPIILIAIVFAVSLGPSYQNVILVIGLLLWPRFARQIRAEALAARESDYVALARVAGCSPARIMAKHMLPNVVPTLLVMCTFNAGFVITLEASLSFLGVGVPPPQPTWGGIVSDGRALIGSAWWVSFFAGLIILLTVLSMNFLGDWIRDRLDPKLRQV